MGTVRLKKNSNAVGTLIWIRPVVIHAPCTREKVHKSYEFLFHFTMFFIQNTYSLSFQLQV